ncbi:MAG: sialidase family protein [Anaerolineae bacterium]
MAIRVRAQTGNAWSEPLNISQSGSAIDPVFAVDSRGGFHLFWQNPLSGFVYSSSEGADQPWSAPVPMRAPFSEPFFYLPTQEDFVALYSPQIVIGPDDFVHGFWLNEAGNLLYSRAPLTAVTDSASWTFPVAVAESAVAWDVALDENGSLHLSYVRPQSSTSFPAGVYYRRSDNSGDSWTDALSVYQSQYLSVTPDQANVKLDAVGDTVLLAWDDRLLDSVFTAVSADGGASWSAPSKMDGRTATDSADSIGPSGIESTIVGQDLFLTWRAEHTAGRCVQYVQWSRNMGETWQPAPLAANDGEPVCPTAGHLISAQDGLLFLLTVYAEDASLQAWDGSQWSEAEAETPLARFTNPVTFRQVSLGCQQTTVTADNHLYVVGCGTGVDSDIWLLQRALGSYEDWSPRFLPAPVWADPLPVASSSDPLLSPALVAAGDGRFHALWSQPPEGIAGSAAAPAGQALYYSRLNAGSWAPGRPVLASPDGQADHPALAADTEGSLFAVWSGGASGQIFFSRAVADRASSIEEWIEPVALPSPQEAGSHPDIQIDAAGTLYVVYAVPQNEDRGIYLVKSEDSGDTWSAPIQLFDAAAADWQMVDEPKLALVGSKIVHVVWIHHLLPDGTSPQALAYARSVDGGETWSEPALAEQGAVYMAQVAAVNERAVHRAWLEMKDGRLSLFHQYSIDGGLAWSDPTVVFTPDATGGPFALVNAPDGLHLLQLAQTVADGRQLLLEWLWDGARWRSAQGTSLTQGVVQASGITAVAAPDGRFGVLYDDYRLLDTTTEPQLQYVIAYTERTWESPSVLPTPLPTLTPTPLPQPTATATPLPSPTPTPAFSRTQDTNAGFSLGALNTESTSGILVISLIPVLLIIVVAFVIGLRITRSR